MSESGSRDKAGAFQGILEQLLRVREDCASLPDVERRRRLAEALHRFLDSIEESEASEVVLDGLRVELIQQARSRQEDLDRANRRIAELEEEIVRMREKAREPPSPPGGVLHEKLRVELMECATTDALPDEERLQSCGDARPFLLTVCHLVRHVVEFEKTFLAYLNTIGALQGDETIREELLRKFRASLDACLRGEEGALPSFVGKLDILLLLPTSIHLAWMQVAGKDGLKQMLRVLNLPEEGLLDGMSKRQLRRLLETTIGHCQELEKRGRFENYEYYKEFFRPHLRRRMRRRIDPRLLE